VQWLRRLYDRVLRWGESPYGEWALFVLAFSESSFFPIAPDVLLIALAIAIPRRSFRYALTCTCGSVLGGMLGYLIGLEFMDMLGFPVIRFYGLMDKYESVRMLFNRYDALAVAIAGFSPIPYKLFTIAGGAFRIDFTKFVLASLVSRGARFFLVAFLIYMFGASIRAFIDRYFNILAVAFSVLLVLGFVAVKVFW
jgi:membrane protein YqaA with SNARE-associated domain